MSIDKLKTKFFTGAWLTDVKHYFTKINEIIDYLNGDGKSGDGSYKVYIALLNQTGTNAPVATVLQNTLGGTPAWSYEDVGQYNCVLSNTFTDHKTVILFGGTGRSGVNGAQMQQQWIGVPGGFSIFVTTDNGVTGVNDYLIDAPIEIRVYN